MWSHRHDRLYWLAWHTLAAVLVLLAPATVIFREPFWLLSRDRQAQSVALAAAHVLAAAWVGSRPSSVQIGSRQVVVAYALAMGLASMALIVAGVGTSPAAFVAGLAGSFLLLTLPVALPRHRLAALALLAAACLLVASAPVLNRTLHLEARLASIIRRPGAASATTTVLNTARYSVVSRHFTGAVVRGVRGGGIERVGRDLLLVTGSGAFYRLRLPDDSTPLAATELTLGLPFDRRRFVEDMPFGVNIDNFRVAGLHVQEMGEQVSLWVSHHHWNRDARCYTLRLSAASGTARDVLDGRPLEWRTVYDTQPCLPIKQRYGRQGEAFPGHQSGGAIVALDAERVLLTVGDHQFDGWTSPETYPQHESADYGKTLQVHTSGTVRPFSSGHRNPQGLTRDAHGRLWLTDHGPQGGDELNLLESSGNYGWPYDTFGTEYGELVWPLQQASPSGGPFIPPVHAWVPSIAPSNLIVVAHERFSEWRGDLLVGSLNDGHLYRVRLEGARVMYVEPIRIGRDVRDLAETDDGRLVLWADDGAIVELRPAESETTGPAVFARCVGCHRNEEDGAGLGPDLRGVVGRHVAGLEGYEYSEALRSVGGTWTRERLAVFLADPAGFAPGTTMSTPGLEPELREALIDHLAGLK
jgi:cytochrome c2